MNSTIFNSSIFISELIARTIIHQQQQKSEKKIQTLYLGSIKVNWGIS